MRTAALIPLALITGVITGCGGAVPDLERQETASRTAASPKRDLTLSLPRVPATEVASAIERAAPKPFPASVRRYHPRPRPKPAPTPVARPAVDAAAPTPEPASAPTGSQAVAEPVALDDAASSGRELAPGRTAIRAGMKRRQKHNVLLAIKGYPNRAAIYFPSTSPGSNNASKLSDREHNQFPC